jgi:hypothetical protein
MITITNNNSLRGAAITWGDNSIEVVGTLTVTDGSNSLVKSLTATDAPFKVSTIIFAPDKTDNVSLETTNINFVSAGQTLTVSSR